LAELLPKREPPRAVDAAPEGRMQQELHAAAIVEEAFENERVMGRQCAEHTQRVAEVEHELLRRGLRDLAGLDQPRCDFCATSGVAGRVAESRGHLGTQRCNSSGQLVTPGRRLTEPE